MFNNSRKEEAPAADQTTIIAEGVVIRGDLAFVGSLHLEGRVEGVISSDDTALLTISEHGSVEGEVRVPRAVINGSVDGNIFSTEHLELAAQARVTGDVHYQVLEMAAGAQVSGRMLHEAESPRSLPQPDYPDAGDEIETGAVQA